MAGNSEISNALILAMAALSVGLVVFPGPLAELVRGPSEGKGGAGDGEKPFWDLGSIRDLIPSGSKGGGADADADGGRPFWTLTNFLKWIYVTSFATTFGASLWASFIGGVIMFKHLPRHQFGNLQGQLFPALFKLNSICLSLIVAIFAVLHPWACASLWERLQVGALVLSLIFNLVNLVILEPKTTKLMRERHKAEKEDGISTEPGVDKKKEIEKASPKLRAINKRFFALHGISSLINLFAFWGQFAHVFYLGSKLSL